MAANRRFLIAVLLAAMPFASLPNMFAAPKTD